MLRLEAMSCGYGPVRAVDGLDLEVPPGEIVALIGANGAGKSSSLGAVCGLVELQQGRILWNGEDISACQAHRRIGLGIALVPEGRRLFPDLTVAENLLVGGLRLPKARQPDNQARVLETFPRLTDRLQQKAGTLSGGEQQMVAIGRALMSQPNLILIDEVSLGLMPMMVDVCYQAIAGLKEDGLSVLLVEQNTTRALDVADRICVLESGRAKWQGTPEQAKAHPTLIESYLGLA